MRWLRAAMGVLALMMMSGCPSEFGRNGRIAKAVHQDTLELTRKICSDQERWDACEGPDKDPAECRKCGG
jgi:hypothetical protein